MGEYSVYRGKGDINMYTIAEVKENLKDGIQVYLLKDKAGNYIMKEVNRLPFYLEGSPGIGKTEVVSQVAKELGLGFVSFSLTHHTRNSLLGLPVIQELECGKYTEYTISEIIAKVMEAKEQGHDQGILLLDEFSCVSDSIMPAMLAFLQTKNIGAHSLPEGWVIVLCGNPKEYNKNARSFDAAVLDRLRKFRVRFESQVFIDYAKEQGFHHTICEYLEKHPNHVYKCVVNPKEETLVTCRGWENLSHAIYGMEQLGRPITEELIRQFVRDYTIASDFLASYKLSCIGLRPDKVADLISGNLEPYVERFKKENLFAKWHVLDVITKTIGDKAKKLEELEERKDLLVYLKYNFQTVNNLHQAINDRLIEMEMGNGFGYGDGCDIPRWNKHDSEYVPLNRVEENLLYDIIDIEEDEFYDLNEDTDSARGLSNEDIMDRVDELDVSTDEDIKQLKKDVSVNVSNLIRFASRIDKGDENMEYRCYKLINTNKSVLGVVAAAKNEEFLRLCKVNFAVSA